MTWVVDGEKLRAARLESGHTQNSLGQAAGIMGNHVAKIERGALRSNLDTVMRLARVLDVAVEDLVIQN